MKASAYVLLMLVVSFVLSIYAAVLGAKEVALSDALTGSWLIFFTLLVMFWAHSDAAERKKHRPINFGFYFFVMWPVVLPYYLFKTRGIEGLVYFVGFVSLYLAPSLFGFVSYAYLAA